MDSAFGLLAIIIFGIAVLATVIYLILKAAAYFKRSFGILAAFLLAVAQIILLIIVIAV